MATLKGYTRFKYETDLDNLPDEIESGTLSFGVTMDGDDFMNGETQEIGLSEESIGLPGDAGSNPIVCIVNLDNDNFVEIGASGVFHQRIDPKEYAVFRVNGVTLTGKADTAAVNIHKFAWED